MVTGGTGLIGSNVCRLLVERGDRVRALVRPTTDHAALVALGVEAVPGDVQSADDVRRAAEGCDLVVSSAALLGGVAQDRDEQQATNVGGQVHAFDTGLPVVSLSSTPFLDHRTSLTEDSPVADGWSDDPYTQTKGAAYVEAKRRVAEEGADIRIVIPGGTFGPGVVVDRALHTTSYTRALRSALLGRITEYVDFPVPWVYAEDVALAVIAAGDVGVAGRTYLAFGAEDAQPTAAWMNLGLEVAGSDHRVRNVTISPGDADATARYGETLVDLAVRPYPVPWFDNSATRAELGYRPRPLREGLEATVDWLRAVGKL